MLEYDNKYVNFYRYMLKYNNKYILHILYLCKFFLLLVNIKISGICSKNYMFKKRSLFIKT